MTDWLPLGEWEVAGEEDDYRTKYVSARVEYTSEKRRQRTCNAPETTARPVYLSHPLYRIGGGPPMPAPIPCSLDAS